MEHVSQTVLESLKETIMMWWVFFPFISMQVSWKMISTCSFSSHFLSILIERRCYVTDI